MIASCHWYLSSTIKNINTKLNLCKKQVCASNVKSKFFNVDKLNPPFVIHKLSFP